MVAAAAANGLQETCGKFPQHLSRLDDQLLQVLPRPQPVSQEGGKSNREHKNENESMNTTQHNTKYNTAQHNTKHEPRQTKTPANRSDEKKLIGVGQNMKAATTNLPTTYGLPPATATGVVTGCRYCCDALALLSLFPIHFTKPLQNTLAVSSTNRVVDTQL